MTRRVMTVMTGDDAGDDAINAFIKGFEIGVITVITQKSISL